MLLKRSSKNAPRTLSCRLASRESGSFKHFMNQLRLCRRSRAVATQVASFKRHWTQLLGNWQRLAGLVAWRKEPSPAPDDFLVGPACRRVRIKAHEHVQVIIQHREAADRDREDFRKFLSRFSIHSLRSIRLLRRAGKRGGHSG